jgi:hypothetical protein
MSKRQCFLYVFLRIVLNMMVTSPLIWDVYPVNVCETFHCRPTMSNAQLHLAVFSLTVTLLQKTFIQIVRYQQISVHCQRFFISRINLRSSSCAASFTLPLFLLQCLLRDIEHFCWLPLFMLVQDFVSDCSYYIDP